MSTLLASAFRAFQDLAEHLAKLRFPKAKSPNATGAAAAGFCLLSGKRRQKLPGSGQLLPTAMTTLSTAQNPVTVKANGLCPAETEGQVDAKQAPSKKGAAKATIKTRQI